MSSLPGPQHGSAPLASIVRRADRVLHGADAVSPCVAVCRMDDATGLCAGCLRTLEEIAAWSALSDGQRRAVWGQLKQRALTLEGTS
ncbi:MAG: DUF1289 domain-containing protein [Burkholderiaceae bacterium]